MKKVLAVMFVQDCEIATFLVGLILIHRIILCTFFGLFID